MNNCFCLHSNLKNGGTKHFFSQEWLLYKVLSGSETARIANNIYADIIKTACHSIIDAYHRIKKPAALSHCRKNKSWLGKT